MDNPSNPLAWAARAEEAGGSLTHRLLHAVRFPFDAPPVQATMRIHKDTDVVLQSDRFSSEPPQNIRSFRSWLQYYALQIAKINYLTAVSLLKTQFGNKGELLKRTYAHEAKFILQHGKTRQQAEVEWRRVFQGLGVLALVLLSGCAGKSITLTSITPGATDTPLAPTITELFTLIPSKTPKIDTATATVRVKPVSPTLASSPTPEQTSTLTTSPTPEVILGGDGVGVAFLYADGNTILQTPPPEIASHLIPTTPDKWQQLMNLTDSAGQPLAWGKPVFFEYWKGGPGDGISPVIPFLVRDIVQYSTNRGEGNVPMYFAILESPAQGGSNFYIKQLTPLGQYFNPLFEHIVYPKTGIPAEWIGQNVPTETILPYAVRRLSDTALLKLLQANVGKVVLVEFPDEVSPVGSHPSYEVMVKDFSDAQLIPQGFKTSPGYPSFYQPAGQ